MPRPLLRAPRLAALALLVAGCGVLDVDNPNNVAEENLDSPAAATPLANGVIGSTVRAYNNILDTYSTVTDELDFVGSQDGYFQLDIGNVSNELIQFSDQAFQRMGEARWLGDDVSRRLAALDAASQLTNRNDLTTSYLYSALTYVLIGDMFDDFTLSDRRESGAPVGEGNMAAMYDSAVVRLDRALVIATATQNAALRTQILGLRARARFGKALWPKLNPTAARPACPTAPCAADPIASPLVNDQGAYDDAVAALALMGTGDYSWSVQPTAAGTGGNNIGNNINSRREMRIGQAYARPDVGAAANRMAYVDGQPVVVLNDPVTGQPDGVLRVKLRELSPPLPVPAAASFLPMIVTSAREMHLILAEAELARGNSAEFTRRINLVRSLGGVPAYDPTNPAHPQPLAMLSHSRRVNLFLQGRRLADMYRFGERDPRWQSTSMAFTRRGCFFPITTTERQSNTNGSSIARPSCQGS